MEKKFDEFWEAWYGFEGQYIYRHLPKIKFGKYRELVFSSEPGDDVCTRMSKMNQLTKDLPGAGKKPENLLEQEPEVQEFWERVEKLWAEYHQMNDEVHALCQIRKGRNLCVALLELQDEHGILISDDSLIRDILKMLRKCD